MSCKSDYIPVMVPGTNAFGWVPTIFCKPFDKNVAMQEYKEALKAPEEPCDVIFRRCLKGKPFSSSFISDLLFTEAMEYLEHPPNEKRSSALVQKQSIRHVRTRLGWMCAFRN